MGVAEEEQRVFAVIYEMLDAQELGNVRRVLDTLSDRPGAAHMATDGLKWETSREAAQAVTAVPGDGLRLVADHFGIHLQGGVASAEGLGRIINESGAERPVRMSGVLCPRTWALGDRAVARFASSPGRGDLQARDRLRIRTLTPCLDDHGPSARRGGRLFFRGHVLRGSG
jgi:hypothetical protein